MKSELNGKEFLFCRRAMQDARELLAAGHPKAALASLKKPISLLERDHIETRMLALVLLMAADCQCAIPCPTQKGKNAAVQKAQSLKKTQAFLDRALQSAIRIEDETLCQTIAKRLAALQEQSSDSHSSQ